MRTIVSIAGGDGSSGRNPTPSPVRSAWLTNTEHDPCDLLVSMSLRALSAESLLLLRYIKPLSGSVMAVKLRLSGLPAMGLLLYVECCFKSAAAAGSVEGTLGDMSPNTRRPVVDGMLAVVSMVMQVRGA